jgi:hypothetical protein
MKRTFSPAAFALAVAAGAVHAQQIEPRGSAGGWDVFLNEATMGCFIQRETAEGIFLQIGTEAALVEMNPDDPIGFMSIWIPGSAPEGANPNELVVMEIGPNTYIGAAASGAREGYHGATVVAQGSELGFDLRNRRSMTILSTSGARVEVQLNESDISEALDALVACQSEVG